MEERSMGVVEERGMFDGSPLQSAMTEFFRTSTPGPLEEAATTPAPFTLTGNTLLGGPNGTAPSLRFGNRELIAVTERSAVKINNGKGSVGKRKNIIGLDVDFISQSITEAINYLSLFPTYFLETFMSRISRTRTQSFAVYLGILRRLLTRCERERERHRGIYPRRTQR